MTIKEFFSLKNGRYFWGNLLGMIVLVVIVVFATLKWLDNYTYHGEAIEVPDAKGMSVKDAIQLFKSKNLLCEVADSTYVKDKTPGCIVEHQPNTGQRVKRDRVIYLTINTLTTPLVVIPDVADNSSLRQAMARLTAAGFQLAPNDTIPGEKDWVYGVRYNNKLITLGEKVPQGATLTLLVGDGNTNPTEENDSISTTEVVVPTETTDDSWF